jgi:hypothetical protein
VPCFDGLVIHKDEWCLVKGDTPPTSIIFFTNIDGSRHSHIWTEHSIYMFKILLVKYGIAWIENLQHPRKQPNHTRPEQVLPMTEKLQMLTLRNLLLWRPKLMLELLDLIRHYKVMRETRHETRLHNWFTL